MKKYIIILGVIITIIAGYRISERLGSSTGGGQLDDGKVPVKAIMTKNMDITDKLKLSGNIVGIEVVNVFSQVPGKINNILVKEGQKVNKGATLFKINRDIVGMDYKLAIVESPITGYIGKIMVDRGMTILPNLPLAEVVNMSFVEAVVRIMEDDINKVKTGMLAYIETGTYPNERFVGIIRKKSPVLDQVSRTQEIRVNIPNPYLKLKHGMYADVEIQLKKINKALVIPSDSVFLSAKGEMSVYKVIENKALLQSVKTGITIDNMIEIKKGLSKGEIVVTLGRENVNPGDSLIVYREDKEQLSESDNKGLANKESGNKGKSEKK